ncbi:MAG: TetR/AcrR family transcriptional regulator [Gemmatimonadales bacterium]
MSPRPYRMQRRRQSADENRGRILVAARELLASPRGAPRFSMEEVARKAGVARMTVYYQFGSLRGLLEALLDSLASAGGMQHLSEAFREPDAREGMDRFIAVFVRFWESDRLVIRALGAFTSLDPDFAAVLAQRSEWRRKGARVLLKRLAKQTGRPVRKDMRDAEDLLVMLTGFATYDALARPKRGPDQVTALLQRLARQALAEG